MNIKALTIVLCLFVTQVHAQQVNKVTIDLINVNNDQVTVTYQPPVPSENEAEFQIPKIVPGTYSISDFGRFVNDFTAMSASGDTLETEKISENRWKITDARRLSKIVYKVDDTYDSDFENTVFEPGGTNIDADDDLYMINTFGFIGYLKEFMKKPFEVTVQHEPGLYGATSMKSEKIDDQTDKFTAPHYFDLADAPILYTIPDTTTMEVGGAEILVSVYSPNNKLTAAEVMGNVKEILTAQKDYLGGKLPIDKYAFLIYLFSGQTKSGAYGALEHSYSSLYVLPEAGIDRIGSVVNDVAAHEFFHIVTPLNIHAEQIGNFDFIEPEMSEHLWMYEGVTEYSAQHVQVKYGLISEEDFLNEMRLKMFTATRYDRDMPFTEMSANVLKPEYEEQYANVYQKGALIGMCLDLLLLKESNGEYNLQQLMQDLSKEYGKNTSFKDDELFDKIESLTYPAVGEFLRTYVSGSERLPFERMLGYAGINFSEEKTVEQITLGGVRLQVNPERELVISDVSRINEFGEALGYQKGDIIKSLNGKDLTLENAQDLINDFLANTEKGDKVKIGIEREINGKTKSKKLKAKAIATTSVQRFYLEDVENPDEEQKKIREAWLKP